MARRRKKMSWILVILLGIMAVALFSTTTPGKPNEDVTPEGPAIVLTYENGVDIENFVFNK